MSPIGLFEVLDALREAVAEEIERAHPDVHITQGVTRISVTAKVPESFDQDWKSGKSVHVPVLIIVFGNDCITLEECNGFNCPRIQYEYADPHFFERMYADAARIINQTPGYAAKKA